MLGGSAGGIATASIGKVIGPSSSAADIPSAIDKILQAYMEKRIENESFVHLVNCVGLEVFKAVLYPKKVASNNDKKAINSH